MVFKRQTQGSVVCPTCGRLVGVQDEECFGCGRKRPGLWGFAPAIKGSLGDSSLSAVVTYGCVGIYVVACLLNPQALMESRGFLSLFSPGSLELFLLGSSGHYPISEFGRWWTILSATWLHGGLLHIFFNLHWLRHLLPGVEKLFGTGRAAVIYVLSGAVGFLGTSAMYSLGLPGILQGAMVTVGASASLCGLLGAFLAYGHVNRDWMMQKSVRTMGLWILGFGLIFPGIDNWAHIFGFIGGYGVARALKPRDGEAAIHLVAGGVLILVSLLAIGWSVVDGLEVYNNTKAAGY